MNLNTIDRIFAETAYVRTGGSPEELRCAEYLKNECAKLGVEARLEAFPVDFAQIHTAVLTVGGNQIPCKGYLCAGSGSVEAPLYYLTDGSDYSLSQCKGKIVLFDGYLGYWRYQDLLKNGAVGFITYDGSVNTPDRDIDHRELRGYVSNGNKIPGVNINVKDAVEIVRSGAQTASICLEQTESKSDSHNVIAELPGSSDRWIVFTAHYDSTSLSQGAYDNMSGSVGLLGLVEYFLQHPHRHNLRFVWCGSEERGLLGAKAYCADHEAALETVDLNINLDMIGSVMGKFIGCCTCEEKAVSYLEYFGLEQGWSVSVRQDVYSSDSTPFADKGIPAISLARIAPPPAGTIHNRYDTAELVSAQQMAADMAFICAFADRMANAICCPIARKMPDNMKEKLDEYLCRKRPKNA